MILKRKLNKVAQQLGKTVLIAFVTIFIAGAVNAQRSSPKKIGVLINGVVWSPYNVGTTGKFVDNPEDFGLYYQWNRKDTTDFVLCADNKPTWLPSNNPCPKGWRVPTLDELNRLLDSAKVTSEWITEKGINGYRFTEKSSGNNIFLPAAGFISCYNGFHRDVGYYGDYWSSTPFRTKSAYLLNFQGIDTRPFCTYGYKTIGGSIRPVAEKTKKQIEKGKRNVAVSGVKLDEISLILEVGEYNQEEEGVIINGIKWATRNLSSHGKFAKNAEAYGALFQWGRKGDGHELRTSPNYPTNDNSSESGIVSGKQNFDSYGQIVSTHDAYGKFIKLDDSHFDWRTPSTATLWNAGTKETPIKTDNDPCPEGWRLPTQTEFATLGNGKWTDTPVAGRYFGSDNTLLFLPAAGYRDDRGVLINVGKRADYWCSEQYLNYNATGYSLCFGRDYQGPSCNCSKKNGLSVRCVADQ